MSNRREWIRERCEFLASIFGIDCLTYTVLSNHLYLVLRSRPDVVAQWSDEEVTRRWWRLFPQQRERDGDPTEPTEADLGMMVNIPSRLAQIRNRLSDVSWWMRCTAENIARRANKDEKTYPFTVVGVQPSGCRTGLIILPLQMSFHIHSCAALWCRKSLLRLAESSLKAELQR